jgi:photosystem II stability/assembly factor-like uncharacterized protein
MIYSKRLACILLIFAVVISTGCSQKPTMSKEPDIAKDVSAIIESKLDLIVSSPKISSSPGDYINEHKQSYDDIIKIGQPALEYLLWKFEQASQNGLREWIMAKACSDILETKDSAKNWSSGKEWYQKYSAKK